MVRKTWGALKGLEPQELRCVKLGEALRALSHKSYGVYVYATNVRVNA